MLKWTFAAKKDSHMLKMIKAWLVIEKLSL